MACFSFREVKGVFSLTVPPKFQSQNENACFGRQQGAFYIFIDFSSYLNTKYKSFKIKSNDDLSMYLLNNAEVATVSGSAFGNKECIRISIASSKKDIKEALNRIKNVLKKLT